VSTTLPYLLESKFAKDALTVNWQVELRTHIKAINFQHINIGMISGGLFDDTLANSVVKDMFYLI